MKKNTKLQFRKLLKIVIIKKIVIKAYVIKLIKLFHDYKNHLVFLVNTLPTQRFNNY